MQLDQETVIFYSVLCNICWNYFIENSSFNYFEVTKADIILIRNIKGILENLAAENQLRDQHRVLLENPHEKA